MRCKEYTSGPYSSYFVGDSFPEMDFEKYILANEPMMVKLVFFKKDDFYSYYDSMLETLKKHYPSHPIFVDLIECAEEDIIMKLMEDVSTKKINNIYITPKDFYQVSKFQNLSIGCERWQNYGFPQGLFPLEYNRLTVKMLSNCNKYVEEIVDWIIRQTPASDLEKILLLDIWMQGNVQYIKERETVFGDVIYVCESLDRESRYDDVLINHFGRCEDIALTAALVLNHPRIKVGCRQVGLCREEGKINNHSWNIVKCDGKDYFLDFTFNITRNPNKRPNAIMARSYSFDYTLLGLDDAKDSYCTTSEYEHDDFSNSSYDRNEIIKVLQSFQQKGVALQWDTGPVKESYIRPNKQ